MSAEEGVVDVADSFKTKLVAGEERNFCFPSLSFHSCNLFCLEQTLVSLLFFPSCKSVMWHIEEQVILSNYPLL